MNSGSGSSFNIIDADVGTERSSRLARERCDDVDPLEAPDLALMRWLNFEANIFTALEKEMVEKHLEEGFIDADGSVDVDSFLKVSLSIQNRRISRMSSALANHLDYIFTCHQLEVRRNASIESRTRIDFLFPGPHWYDCETFPKSNLTLLDVKSICKNHWQQLLSKARHIPKKHFLTLDSNISEQQITEMKNSNIQLILPRGRHPMFSEQQGDWLIDLETFIAEVKQKQTEMWLY